MGPRGGGTLIFFFIRKLGSFASDVILTSKVFITSTCALFNCY